MNKVVEFVEVVEVVKNYMCRFNYSQKVITLSSRRFITVSGVFTTLSGVFYYIIGHVLQYRAFITLSVGTGPIVCPVPQSPVGISGSFEYPPLKHLHS